jgi:hypothetical protein
VSIECTRYDCLTSTLSRFVDAACGRSFGTGGSGLKKTGCNPSHETARASRHEDQGAVLSRLRPCCSSCLCRSGPLSMCVPRGGPGEERRDRDWHAQSTKRGKECERAREIERDRERQEGGREGAREEERERGSEGGRDRMSATPVVNSGPFLKKSQVKGIRAQQGLGPEGWRSSDSSHSWRGLMGARASRPVVKMWEGE